MAEVSTKQKLSNSIELLNETVTEREEKLSQSESIWDEDKIADFGDVTQQLRAIATDLAELNTEVEDDDDA